MWLPTRNCLLPCPDRVWMPFINGSFPWPEQPIGLDCTEGYSYPSDGLKAMLAGKLCPDVTQFCVLDRTNIDSSVVFLFYQNKSDTSGRKGCERWFGRFPPVWPAPIFRGITKLSGHKATQPFHPTFNLDCSPRRTPATAAKMHSQHPGRRPARSRQTRQDTWERYTIGRRWSPGVPVMRRFHLLLCLTLLLGTLTLGACGQKGDLYLPDEKTANQQTRG